MTTTASPWGDLLGRDDFEALTPGAERFRPSADVVVVGGGVVGMATALACHRAGLGTVALLEGASLGAGATGAAAGLMIPDAHQGSEPDTFVNLGRLSLASWWELHETVPGGVGLLDLDWVGLDPQPPSFVSELPSNAEPLDAGGLRERFPDLVIGATSGLLLRNQARCNPLLAVARLAKEVPIVATGVRVNDLVLRGERVIALDTSVGRVSVGAVVFATGTAPPFPKLGLNLQNVLVKGHLLVTDPIPTRLLGTVSPVATQLEDGRLLVGGTLDEGDTSPGVDAKVISRMRASLGKTVPSANGIPISNAWCCFRPAVADRLPLIDRLPGLNNAWFTCGHYRTGILMAAGTGDLLAKWVASGRAPEALLPFTSHQRKL